MITPDSYGTNWKCVFQANVSCDVAVAIKRVTQDD